MIEILPMKNYAEEQEILAQIENAGPEARVLAMCERGALLGWAALELEGEILRILQIYAEGYDFSRKPRGEEVFILDSLMRSAASYGENFGANQIETAFPDFYGFFKVRGFDCDEKHAFTPMCTIVKYEFH
ncbi:hypothetical protein D7X94_07915 [Acutalibacter sp. 1XD8-33]|uniref:hypothetical protein n=1 Tax=Acutalibacter sp. 1XD8-33 TaxID=2320081 RepID=UPI000EA256D3|nr:hypothetical protein [Acutalibacter sp. 1XD8-33]RKJ40409.1 hypothetical protein D7X94_07915 [Acutalibacter sp. 1XD8-33]